MRRVSFAPLSFPYVLHSATTRAEGPRERERERERERRRRWLGEGHGVFFPQEEVKFSRFFLFAPKGRIFTTSRKPLSKNCPSIAFPYTNPFTAKLRFARFSYSPRRSTLSCGYRPFHAVRKSGLPELQTKQKISRIRASPREPLRGAFFSHCPRFSDDATSLGHTEAREERSRTIAFPIQHQLGQHSSHRFPGFPIHDRFPSGPIHFAPLRCPTKNRAKLLLKGKVMLLMGSVYRYPYPQRDPGIGGRLPPKETLEQGPTWSKRTEPAPPLHPPQ